MYVNTLLIKVQLCVTRTVLHILFLCVAVWYRRYEPTGSMLMLLGSDVRVRRLSEKVKLSNAVMFA